jgi:hypothetical protein
MNISYLMDEFDMNGIIVEPNPPDNVMDLSDVTILQSCAFLLATPCILCIQLLDLLSALYRASSNEARKFGDYMEYRKRMREEQEAMKNKKKRHICHRLFRTLTKCCIALL